MRRVLLPIVAAFVLVLSLGALAAAQDATPSTGTEVEENACPEAVLGSPVASTEAPEAMASPTATEETAMGSPSAGAECSVEIKDFAFRPAAIEVSVGTTVTWENYDQIAHTVTGDNGEFQSGRLDGGKSFSFTFDKAGTFTYHCEFHPGMTGTVVVK
jgi:plastocyanin